MPTLILFNSILGLTIFTLKLLIDCKLNVKSDIWGFALGLLILYFTSLMSAFPLYFAVAITLVTPTAGLSGE